MKTARELCLMSLKCLYLEVHESIADDVSLKVKMALKEADDYAFQKAWQAWAHCWKIDPATPPTVTFIKFYSQSNIEKNEHEHLQERKSIEKDPGASSERSA